MIKNSFIFLKGVSYGKERKLWEQGIKDWADFLEKKHIRGFSMAQKEIHSRAVQEAQMELLDGNSSYFKTKLPSTETWRLYDYFKEECCFLDVEIDSFGKIILVGISNYFMTNFFVSGANLEKVMLEKELQKYKLAATFNGSSFDLPKLRKQFGLEINIPHIDLKPLCLRLGLKGGLKEIERKLELKRPSHLQGNPVDLWKAFHASGDREYLELLLEYNREDIENLKGIMEYVFKKMKERLQQNI